MNNLAFLLASTGDSLDEAMKLAKRGLESLGRRDGLSVKTDTANESNPNPSYILGLATSPRIAQNEADRHLADSLLDTVGWIYLKKKMYDSAVQCFQTAIKDDSGSADYHYHLGAAYFQKGDKQLARTELSAALKTSATPTQQSVVRSLLAQL